MPECRSYRALLLDLDGTLADTAPDLVAALNVMRAQRDLPPLTPADLTASEIANGSRSMMRAHLVESGEDIEPLRPTFLAAYDATGHTRTHLFDGMNEVLAHVETQGKPWAIVTNKPTAQTVSLLPVLAMDSTATMVVCSDTYARAKPHPDGLLAVCAQLALEPAECLFVGDAAIDCAAAGACGMPFVAAGWGYWDGKTEQVLAHPRDLLHLL